MNRRAATVVLLLSGACRLDMHDQPKSEPYEASAFFADGVVSRAPPEGTVARGDLSPTSTTTIPRAKLLARGRERYDIYCSPCHGYAGHADGLVVQRGMKKPTTFHSERLRNVSDAYLVKVIAKGFGAMYDYSASVKPADRWAIAAYIRALQLSQNARLADLPADARGRLEAQPKVVKP